MRICKKIDSIIYNVSKYISLLCFILLFVILIGNVIVRFTSLSFKMSWYTEVVEMLMAYMVMGTATVLARDKEHFRVDFLFIKHKDNPNFYYLEVVTNLLSLSFYILLLLYSFSLTLKACQTMPVLQISKRWSYMAIPINSVFLCIYSLRDTIENLGIACRKKPVIA